ncbi:MAG: hypothetical protein M3P70_05475 [Actinomycetota bacterium]|nr:hypothetical protein [Actinomycetota bacterium]
MFWRGGDGMPEEEASEGHAGPIRIERDAPRPATILRVAGELEERGGKILELFKEIRSPLGEVVLPIHLRQGDQDFFVEVATAAWDPRSANEALERAAVLRGSEHAGAGLELVSAYPVPPNVEFFFGRSPAALLQLDLLRVTPDRPEASAGLFREVGSKHWGVELDYEPGYLPLVEELLMAALEGDEVHPDPPVSEELVVGLGCFLGETVRRNAGSRGSWLPAEEWGEGPLVEVGDFLLAPVGKARAFLNEGQEESLAFYADYVLEQIGAGGSEVGNQDRTGNRP